MSPRVLPIGRYKVLCMPSPEHAVCLPEASVRAGRGPVCLKYAAYGGPVLLSVIHQTRPRLYDGGRGGDTGLATLVTHNNFARKRRSCDSSFDLSNYIYGLTSLSPIPNSQLSLKSLESNSKWDFHFPN